MKQRLRNFWACVSITFNQVIHLGNAPYPLSLSETCYIRQYAVQYRIGLKVIDFLFGLFGELEHCKQSYLKGMEARRYYT